MRKKTLTIRSKRFTPSHNMKTIVKNHNARSSSFWLDVENLSDTGVCIGYDGLGCLPIEIGSILNVTLDINCKIFSRPIHLKVEVIRKKFKDIERHIVSSESISLGTKILEVESLHKPIWEEGMKTLKSE